MEFRTLRADEIELRVGTVSKKGATLLLYKDARCDMNVLDETVGTLNWKREHTRDNANCIVSIWDSEKSQWISKEDTGTESNTEKEKGLASDSFKRACVNFGIGRELYTSPFVFIQCPTVAKENGRGYDLSDKFYFSGAKVSEIRYDEFRNISKLVIKDKHGSVMFNWSAPDKPLDNPKGQISATDAKVMKQMLQDTESDVEAFLKYVADRSGYSANSVDELTREQYVIASQAIERKRKK